MQINRYFRRLLNCFVILFVFFGIPAIIVWQTGDKSGMHWGHMGWSWIPAWYLAEYLDRM